MCIVSIYGRLTSITTNADGSFNSEVRYSAFGKVRYSVGTTVTDKLYTGQQQKVEIGLDYYLARFYNTVIAYFIQSDSIIPQAEVLQRQENRIQQRVPEAHLHRRGNTLVIL